MNVIALIPARYNSSRFPGKLMQKLGDKTVIRATCEATLATGLFQEVVAVTDSPVIEEELRSHGLAVMRSRKEHSCGSDRIAEAAEAFPQADLILNVQGDEPFTAREPLEALLKVFAQDPRREIALASLMCPLTEPEEIQNPNNVKVVTDREGCALLFSRAPIPFVRDAGVPVKHFRHIGVYAFRRQALLDFARTPAGPLEQAEKLECLRFLENGKKIKMVEVPAYGVGIDTPEDLHRAKGMLPSRDAS